ncbi:MAG: RidA family protein [Desulfitobacteriaceae bacterium]
MGQIEQKLIELGIELPHPPKPVGIYLPAVTVNDLVYTSGTGCRIQGGELLYEGKLGIDLSIEQGQQAARQAAINLLAILKVHLGNLDRVKKVVKVLGFVNSTADFVEQPKVINGASELLMQVFGDRGRHARSAIGTSVLPSNMPVEIEIIVQIGD